MTPVTAKRGTRRASSKTRPSIPPPSNPPRLSEYARSFVFPATITRTIWPRIVAKAAEFRLSFDWWQDQAGQVCFGYDERGKYATTVGGIGLSIPRQVGKTWFVLVCMFIMCILFPGYQVVWTSHHLRTTTKTLTTAKGLARRKLIAPYVRTVRTANGEGQVEFVNGSIIMFGARSQGFGRGFDEIDAEVFDEAQIMDTSALEDMIAATNQARHEHGALLFFMGTPPRPKDKSGPWLLRRAEARDGQATDAVWLEIGADPESDPDDRSLFPTFNPSYPHRTPLESMLRLRKNLGNEDSWNREGRGVYDQDRNSSLTPFPPGVWERAQRPVPAGLPMVSLAVAASRDLDYAAIVATAIDGETVYVRPMQHGPGTGWVVDRLRDLQAQHDVDVVIDGRGPAAVLIPTLEREGVRLRVLKTGDVYDACAEFYTGVVEGRVAHGGYAALDDSLRSSKRPSTGERWIWRGAEAGSDISMLRAATFAVWAAGNPIEVPTSAYDDHDLMVLS